MESQNAHSFDLYENVVIYKKSESRLYTVEESSVLALYYLCMDCVCYMSVINIHVSTHTSTWQLFISLFISLFKLSTFEKKTVGNVFLIRISLTCYMDPTHHLLIFECSTFPPFPKIEFIKGRLKEKSNKKC